MFKLLGDLILVALVITAFYNLQPLVGYIVEISEALV